MCLCIFDFLCVCACPIVLRSPVWVVENYLSGHCRLVVLVLDGAGDKTGWGEKQWCSISHISSYWYYMCVCAFVMTACQPAPQLPQPLLSQCPLLSSITFWMGTLGDGGGCGALSGRDKVRVSGPGWGGLSPVSALEPSAPPLEGRQVRHTYSTYTMIEAPLCL